MKYTLYICHCCGKQERQEDGFSPLARYSKYVLYPPTSGPIHLCSKTCLESYVDQKCHREEGEQ